ncbi:MAG: hypothetical protein JWP87_3489 [Labilithrix sp.]|nr:hypothetical protein [Labilithrix sp.]
MTTRARLACGAGVLIGTAFALAAGCSVVTSYDGFTPEGPPCGKRVPDRPGAGTGGPGGGNLFGALSAVRFLEPPGAPPLGYDLDKLCTCPDRRACKNPKAVDQQCDVPGTGIDNAAGGILNVLFPPQADALLQSSLRHGKKGIMIRVQGWDGSANDSDVSVSVFNIVGLKGDEEGGAPATFDGGADEFIVDDASLLNAMDLGSRYFDTSAYVTNGLLVAALDYDFRLEVPTGDAAAVVFVPLRAARLVGKIERVGTTGLRMSNAQLVGRVPIAEIFAQLAAIGLCQNNPMYPTVKASTCAALDLPAKPANDGKDVGCDALSIAIGITAGPAKIGGHAPSAGAQSPCGDQPVERCQ